MNSIRSRLLIWQLSALLLVAMIAGTLTFVSARQGFDQVRDYGLQQIARSVLRHDETPIPDPPIDVRPDTAAWAEPLASNPPADASQTAPYQPSHEAGADADPDEGQFVSQIWSPSGDLVFSSLDDDGPSLQPTGFHLTQWQDQTWRTYTVTSNGRTAQVAVSIQDRESAFYELLPWVLGPMVLLVLLLTLVIHQAVKRALQPLRNLTAQLGQRAVSELHPLDTADLPAEVAPLAHTLNQLLTRLGDLLSHQRDFFADAAHELNTPLAAIKLQAQLARRAPGAERETSLNELDTGIERAIHLASQLLQLARSEPDAGALAHSEISWNSLVRQAVIQLFPLAEQKNIDLGLLQCQPATLTGDFTALRAVLENLIDNALRYSPEGAKVDVELTTSTDGWAVLTVSDNGPGIAPEQREAVMQRFVRLSSGESTGSGLGLPIVQSTLTAHGGNLKLTDTIGGGLTVTVRLPLAPPSTSEALLVPG